MKIVMTTYKCDFCGEAVEKPTTLEINGNATENLEFRENLKVHACHNCWKIIKKLIAITPGVSIAKSV